MSLLLLIDGYNVVAPVAAPARVDDREWLHRERMLLIHRLAEHLPADVREKTCVVFDATNPPPDRPNRFKFEGIEVQFAIGYDEADDLIEELIAAHTAPKNLTVVSSDHRIQAAAKRRSCLALDAEAWLDGLIDNRVQLAVEQATGKGRGDHGRERRESTVDAAEVDVWMREFGFK